MADDSESIFAKAGFKVPGSVSTPAAAEKKPARAAEASSIFEAAGFKMPNAKADAPVRGESEYPTPEKFAQGTPGTRQTTFSKLQEAFDPVMLASTAARNTAHDTVENFVAAKSQAGRGISDLKQGEYLPSFPSGDPRTWSGGGILNTAAGALGMLTSPISGTANALVARPVTALTGNPDIGDRAAFVASSIVPVRGGGKIAEAVAPSTKATNALVAAIGPENVPALVADMRANPRMTAADLSDNVRLRTQGLMAGGTPDVQDLIARTTRERTASLPGAVNSAYTEAMGPAPNVVQMVEGLKDRARKAGSEAIQPALANAKPVDVSPVIAAIDEKLKPGITAMLGDTKLPLSNLEQELVRVKSRLTDGENQVFDPKKLHAIQSDIGDQAFQLSKSPDPKDRRMGSQLRDINEKLIDQIDVSSGGAYRPARAKFKDAKDIHEAFDAGFDTLKNRPGVKGLDDRPEAFREWMKDATPEEVVARRIGTRSDIDQKIRAAKNQALAGENITKIEYNQEKLRDLFGEKEANRLIRVMTDAQREAATNAAILHGSKTAETTKAAKDIEVRKIGGGNPLQYVAPVAAEMLGQGAGLPGVGFTASMAAKGIHLGAQYLGARHDIAKNFEFAKNALSTGPAREETINRILSHPDVVSELKKRSNALTAP